MVTCLISPFRLSPFLIIHTKAVSIIELLCITHVLQFFFLVQGFSGKNELPC